METLIVTGASGALGQRFVADWLRTRPDGRAIVLVRSETAARACEAAWRHAQRHAVRFVRADLLDAQSMRDAAQSLPPVEHAVAVHLAADVSWHKSFDEMREMNVDGTLRFAEFARNVARACHFIYVSTAFTRMHDWVYRNGYEESKAAGEHALRTQFGMQFPISTFSCSLVVGSSVDGAISRFHGLYPLIRFIASLAPPFLVGNRVGRLDIVPIDWVADELVQLAHRCATGMPFSQVVAAAGETRLSYEQIVRLIESRLDVARQTAGLPKLDPVPILRMRQWAFLKRSLSTWRPEGISTADFRYFERLLQIYGVYAESEIVRAPENTTRPAPPCEHFLPLAVDYWLAHTPDSQAGLKRQLAAGTI
ncbi:MULTISPECIES: SDR family oxidoreductase [unclassified Paraburkholderia]|uniref:SDR family oxidoreductase n=1 Tax=unclassified Paraburkholderia TaxID=2615204 RepID=UPI002AAF34F2|nr:MULTISPECIES: SDR family oxidoreductase [unclassified Paraburkholderia]